jgi:1,2-diacylglycerol 3-beta-galactosyltransferase
MSSHSRTILLLISRTGAGHLSAAKAVRAAMNLLVPEVGLPLNGHGAPDQGSPEAMREATLPSGSAPSSIHYRVEIVDAFASCGLLPLRSIIFLYAPMIRYVPRLYGFFFYITNRPFAFKAITAIMYPFISRRLARLFTEQRPDVVVSLHPLLQHMPLRTMRRLGIDVPFLTVITDLMNVHLSWVAPEVDACVVPTSAARDCCLRYGMPAEKIHLLGMPIDPKFTVPAEPKETLRKQLGLAPDLPTILLVGGGEGAADLERASRALWRSEVPAQLLVVCGRNERLRAHLQHLQQELPDGLRQRDQILGFVQNMPTLMRAADVIVTKAGPGTITEAMACELPILLTSFVPGQEEANVGYVVNNHIGRMTETPEKLVAALRELLQPNSDALQEMRRNMVLLRNRHSAANIARLILDYLPDNEGKPLNHSQQQTLPVWVSSGQEG